MKESIQFGFTLIELLIVISIIGILASLTLVSYSGAQKQARDSQRKSDLGQIKNSLENYAGTNNGMYPTTVGAVADFSTICPVPLTNNFISVCLKDPLDTVAVPRVYHYASDGYSYLLYANTESAAAYWFTCSSGKNGSLGVQPALAANCN